MRHYVVSALVALGLGLFLTPQAAVALSKQQEIVDKATATIRQMKADPEFPQMPTMLSRARAVIIFPDVIKAGLIIGGEGGSGVLLVKDEKGEWSYPAFFTMGSGSLGLQIGVASQEIVLVIMNEDALQSVIANQVKLGGDIGVAAGNYGKGSEASTTTNFDADIYSYAKSSGGYVGMSVEGAVINRRDDWNYDYYGPGASARPITMAKKYRNTGADDLRKAVAESAAAGIAMRRNSRGTGNDPYATRTTGKGSTTTEPQTQKTNPSDPNATVTSAPRNTVESQDLPALPATPK